MRKRRKRLERGIRETHPTEDDARQSLKRCRGRERARNSKSDSSRTKSRSKSTDASKRYHRTKPIPPTYVEDADAGRSSVLFASRRVVELDFAELSASDRSRSPPSSQQPTLKKKPSITMPGSLFPRSSSLEPDTRDNCLLASTLTGPSGMANGASSTSQSHSNETDPSSLDAFVSPWRTRPVSSVHHAIQRFNITAGEEADFSLRLPTPHSSPAKPSANPPSGADTSLQLASDFVKPSSSAKGKERMQDDDLLYILGDVPNADTRIQAKERELVAAREEHQRQRLASGGHSGGTSDERERERDKERIRMLEEEVKRLREEVPIYLWSCTCCSLTRLFLPIALQKSASITWRAAAAAATAAYPATTSHPHRHLIVFIRSEYTVCKRPCRPSPHVSASRGPYHCWDTQSVENEEAGPAYFQRTIGKNGSVPQRNQDGPTEEGWRGWWWSWNCRGCASGGAFQSKQEHERTQLGIGAHPARGLASTITSESCTDGFYFVVSKGDPRESRSETQGRSHGNRRTGYVTYVICPIFLAMCSPDMPSTDVAKRQLTQVSTGGSSSSGSSSSQSAPTSKSGQASLESSKRPWSSQSTNETDITTPSLCSDNERDGDGSLEDQVPSTPPGPRSTHPERRSDIREPEVIGVDMESDIVGGNTRPQLIRTGSPRIPRTFDMFEKCPPMSPIPHPTPRKTAPSRARRISTPKPKYVPPDSDSDNGTNRAETPFLSLIPGPRSNKSTLSGKGRPPGAQNGSSSRRTSNNGHRSLEEELWSAGAHVSGDDLMENDLFVGTGTRSQRRGFLARGGAGGSPVLMGVGYVCDAQVSDGEVRNKESTRRIHKSASQGSLIPRLGGKSCS